jgi:hypothetical protein
MPDNLAYIDEVSRLTNRLAEVHLNLEGGEMAKAAAVLQDVREGLTVATASVRAKSSKLEPYPSPATPLVDSSLAQEVAIPDPALAQATPSQDDGGPAPAQNVRHDLCPQAVKAQIADKIERLTQDRIRMVADAKMTHASYLRAQADGTVAMWPHPPAEPEMIASIVDRWIETERGHYALVRVIELPTPGKRFVLVYGDQVDAAVIGGTGPFATVDDAAGWFLRFGR